MTDQPEAVAAAQALGQDAEDADALAIDHRSTAAIAGHPLHPMFVPLPIGLLVAATVSDVAHVMTRDRFFARASRWLVGGSVVTGAPTAALGAIDFSTIRAARRPIGIAHAVGNTSILLMAFVSLMIRRGSTDRVPPAAMALSLVSSLMLVVTGWLGGELSYRQRIGVVPLSER